MYRSYLPTSLLRCCRSRGAQTRVHGHQLIRAHRLKRQLTCELPSSTRQLIRAVCLWLCMGIASSTRLRHQSGADGQRTAKRRMARFPQVILCILAHTSTLRSLCYISDPFMNCGAGIVMVDSRSPSPQQGIISRAAIVALAEVPPTSCHSITPESGELSSEERRSQLDHEMERLQRLLDSNQRYMIRMKTAIRETRAWTELKRKELATMNRSSTQAASGRDADASHRRNLAANERATWELVGRARIAGANLIQLKRDHKRLSIQLWRLCIPARASPRLVPVSPPTGRQLPRPPVAHPAVAAQLRCWTDLSPRQLVGKLYLTCADRLQIDALVVGGVRVHSFPGTSAYKDTPRYRDLIVMVQRYESLKSKVSSAQQAARQQQDILALLLTVRSFCSLRAPASARLVDTRCALH